MRSRLLAIGACLHLAAAGALACQCGFIPDPTQGLSKATAVFEGTAIDVTDPMWFGRRAWFTVRRWCADESAPFSVEKYLEDYGIRVRILSDRSWKGNALGEIDLLTGRGGGDCGFTFETGHRYLVFARRNRRGRLETDICLPTRLVARGTATRILGKPEATR